LSTPGKVALALFLFLRRLVYRFSEGWALHPHPAAPTRAPI
jgi:hypothetical protein